jgi:2-dehydro-3-deoxygalactonokinase
VAELPQYVCVDWGLSRLRASLCGFKGNECVVHDKLSGPGISIARHSVEETLFEVIAPWTRKYGPVPIMLAGGVGSNIGWRTTPYLACPFTLRDLSAHCIAFTTDSRDIVIVPGLECTNGFGEYDTMRGEELQLLGWLYHEVSRQTGSHLVCLPGTHTKWVLVEDGRVLQFQSAVTGELYGLIRDHSILLAQNGESPSVPDESGSAFSMGVAACREAKGNLSHALFSARGRILSNALNADDATSYLSGLLIAADVMAALELFQPSAAQVSLVGEPALCQHFANALRAFGLESETMDGNGAARQGFSIVYRDLYQPRDQLVSV